MKFGEFQERFIKEGKAPEYKPSLMKQAGKNITESISNFGSGAVAGFEELSRAQKQENDAGRQLLQLQINDAPDRQIQQGEEYLSSARGYTQKATKAFLMRITS